MMTSPQLAMKVIVHTQLGDSHGEAHETGQLRQINRLHRARFHLRKAPVS
jgi:hypothetical protein